MRDKEMDVDHLEHQADHDPPAAGEAGGETGSPGPPGHQGAPRPERSTAPFAPDGTDTGLALAAFILGFLFIRWVLSAWQGWGTALFTLIYCGTVTIYLHRRQLEVAREGWFWLGVAALTGLSYGLWADFGLEPWRSLLLLGSAVYWVICATGRTILGRTSSLFWLDGINALLIIPFRNFGCQYQSLARLAEGKRFRWQQASAVALGVVLALSVTGAVLPLLLEADSGGFARLADGLTHWLKAVDDEVWVIFFQGILAIPMAAGMFGLIAGSAHRRGTDSFTREGMLKTMSDLQIIPPATVYTLLGLLGLLYSVFILSQLPYFFSAFTGKLPGGWLVYSEYARRGFFELCTIAAINLAVLTAANLCSRRQYRQSMALRLFNALLSAITIILIGTAFSKMSLYIGAYGLSMRRLLPCFFMVFMAIVFGAVIARQRWSFSITRLAVMAGVVMLCSLCLLDPDSAVTRYNTGRHLAGTLNGCDTDILYRSGPAGVQAALRVYARSDDLLLREELRQYLRYEQEWAQMQLGTARDNLQTARARRDIGAVLDPPAGIPGGAGTSGSRE